LGIAFEVAVNKDRKKTLKEFVRKIKKQKPLPPEFSRTVDKYFWELT
jgi:hypothetical protein